MKKTQVLEITKALAAGEKLTALDALKDFGSMRLAAHVVTIQKKYNILLERRTLTGKSRYGTTVSFAQYWMRPKDAKMVTKLLNKKQK